MNAAPSSSPYLKWVLVILLVADLGYSFYQYLQEPLDGDIAPIVLPSDWYAPVMSAPFGWGVLTNGERYAATNRYFVHWSITSWFKKAPFFLQGYMDPVQSIYWSCAIFKLLVHLLLLYLLAALVSAKKDLMDIDFLLAAALLAPLFQANGYVNHMGIISPSIIYTFFYAFPMALLLLWLFPFLSTLQSKEGWGSLQSFPPQQIMAFFLLIFLAFSGPLIQPVVLLLLPSLLLIQGWKIIQKSSALSDWKEKIKVALKQYPRLPLISFIGFALCALYSFYIGTYNAENEIGVSKSLAERFALLPQGVFYLFTEKLGASLLLLTVILNRYLLSQVQTDDRVEKLRFVFRWILILSLLYLLLLPLGGYREYRPFILRADTFLPITLALLYCFGASSLLLLQKMEVWKRKIYAAVISICLLVFVIADKPGTHKNHCEQAALYQISASDSTVVELNSDCLVMSWGPILAPEESELNSRLLHFWQLTDQPILYFQNIVSEK